MDRKQILAEVAALGTQLRNKISERDRLSVEILGIEERIRAMNQMYFTDALAEKGRELTAVGLTEAIRILLRKQQRPMNAATLKGALEILGFDLKRFKNPSAAIHNTLIRMSKAGELDYNERDKTYRLRSRAFYGDVPDPFGNTLGEMLNPGWKKK